MSKARMVSQWHFALDIFLTNNFVRCNDVLFSFSVIVGVSWMTFERKL